MLQSTSRSLKPLYSTIIKPWTMMSCLCVITETLIRKLSNDTETPLIVYANHCLNLDVDQWIESNVKYTIFIHNIHACMIQLQQLKNGARLCLPTDLCAIKNNSTQCSGKYDMGKWYIELESIIQTITKLEEYILISTKRRKLGELMEHRSRSQRITRNSHLKGILYHDA